MRWQSFEAWVGSRGSAFALFGLALLVFAIESAVVPAYGGRDVTRYVQTWVQLPYHDIVLPSVMNTRGPFAALGVGVPLELGGFAAEAWLALMYAGSILAWAAVGLTFGRRAAILTAGLLLVYPGYGILFHGLSGDSMFAAAFSGWALLLTRAMLRPSVRAFAFAGLGMGALVLVRPSNQVLIVMSLVPFVLSAPWRERLRWFAAFFVGSALLTQGWKAIALARYGDGTGLRPSAAVVGIAALLLAVVVVPARYWAWLAGAAAVLTAVFLVVERPAVKSPTGYLRTVAQLPGGNPFVFRVFEIDPIVSSENGPASRELERVVRRDLLTQEPYRSYGVTIEQVLGSGSDRIFADLQSLPGVDLQAVTSEAIRRHPWHFARGIGDTLWTLMWAGRAYAPEPGADAGGSDGGGQPAYVFVNGRRLPAPSEGQPIPSSRVGPVFGAAGEVRQVWRSATDYSLVFDDPRDQGRVARFDRDTEQLVARLPTRGSDQDLVHRLNQASHAFPASLVWLVLGLVALAVRRPGRILVALAPSVAALVVVVATGLIAFPVGEYVVPMSPAFVLLTAVGLVGERRLPEPA